MPYHFSLNPVITVGLFAILLGLEAISPLRRRKRARGPRLAVNGAVTALGLATGALSVRPVALAVAARVQAHSFGLLAAFPLPFWVQVMGGILLMDLTFYYWHRLNHTRPLLWRFHNVHHADPDMDVSTSFRFHFGEVLYSTLFRILQVGLLGILPVVYVTYELIFNCATMFHHSNLRLPLPVERFLNKVFVTPRMHGVHHSILGPECNANYSVIFSWWDRLNRSLRLNVSQADLIIGVAGYLQPGDNRFWPLMQFPFRKQRPYWRWPSGKAAARRAAAIASQQVMVE